MRKNCLTAFCSATFCICKLPLRKRDLFLKTTTKRLSIWRQKRTMRWMAGYLGGTCIKNILNFHGIQMNGSDVDTFGCLSCIWRGMALPSLGLRPISSSALCASLIATESAESNLQMTGWEHEKRHLSLGHQALDPSLMSALLYAVAIGGRKSGLIKRKLHEVLRGKNCIYQGLLLSSRVQPRTGRCSPLLQKGLASGTSLRRRLSSRKTICPFFSNFFGEHLASLL